MYGVSAVTCRGARLAGRGCQTWSERGRFVCGALTVGVAALSLLAPASRTAMAFAPPRVATRAADDDPQVKNFAAILHASEEAGTLLSRARQAIDRQDWKLVVDSLQRIIELPGEHVLTSDGRVFESARRHAHRQIAALPPAGLAAYRLMYDSEAAALLAKASAQHDLALLRDIVDRYLVTKVGDDAAVMLADWLMDEGRFAEAVAVLQLVKTIYPDSDLPPWTLPSHLAVCYASMGRRQRAESALNEAVTTRPSESVAAVPRAAEWADRLKQIRAYLQRPAELDETSAATIWPLAYGRPARDGIMPAVAPSFGELVPWSVSLNLPGDLTSVEQYASERKLLPTANMVVDGRTLVVKAGPILEALDVDTFEVLWRHEPGSGEDAAPIEDDDEPPVFMPRGNMNNQPGNSTSIFDSNAHVRQLLHDTVGAGLAAADGLVFTVEWSEGPPAVKQTIDRRFMALGMNVGFSPTQANHIVAYRLQDGERVWTNGPRPGDTQLTAVEYLSAPVPVEGQLLAPCRVESDLYAVVLDPATGRVVRSIYLCGTGGGPFDSLYARSPCVADGVVYIPTGRGVVIALESANWSIRWAVRYDDTSDPTPEDRWKSTPIIAVADAVLVAPPDADYLFCLDRATGERRWRAARKDSNYVLGATDRHVWLGGEQVQLINVETGDRIWSKQVDEPSGRGVVSGERVYQPTTKGLVALNALTGEVIDLEPRPDTPVLGNLLAFNHTLYSTDVTTIREFPDMERGYAEARARHEQAPADPACAVRLARLELLRHAPDKALAVLEHLPEPLEDATDRRRGQINHLTVTAMLELAGSGTVDSDAAHKLLERARQIAMSPQDAVDSALALGAYHQREQRPLESCQQYLSLALSAAGDQMTHEGDDYQRRVRSVAVLRLADVAKTLSTEQHERLEATLHEKLTEATAKHDSQTVLWLAESPALGDVSRAAELQLGAWEMQDLRFEQAEGYLRNVLRQEAPPAIRADATARLAAIYLLPGEFHQPVSALGLLDTLEREYAAEQVPASVLVDLMDVAADTPANDLARLSGAEAAHQLRQRIDRHILARHEATLGPITVGAVRDPSSASLGDTRPLLVRDGRIEPLADRQLVLSDGTDPRVEARQIDAETKFWPAELKLVKELAVSSRVAEVRFSQQRYGWSNSNTLPARALADGQTLILNTTYGIHAIGLLSGKRLWSRRFEPPLVRGQKLAGSDTWLWVQDGYVISVDRGGQLEVARTTSGDRPLWTRKRPGQHWYAVRARGPYVVAVDEQLETADVYRLEDGRDLGKCNFKQDRERPINILLFDDVICGPVGRDTVVALELATPGVERWRVQTNVNLAQIFKPGGDLLAVSDIRGNVRLIDANTGQPRMADVLVEACEDGVTDGTLSNGVLYVSGYKRQRGSAEQQRRGVAAVRVEDRQVLWSKDDLGVYTCLDQGVLECAQNVIPVASMVSGDGARQANVDVPRVVTAAKLGLTLLDKATGELVGRAIEVPLDTDAGSTRDLSLAVYPGLIQVTAGANRLRFPFAPATQPSADRPASRPAASSVPAKEREAGQRTEAGTP